MHLRQWLSAGSPQGKAPMPFSFHFAGKPAAELLPNWVFSTQSQPDVGMGVYRWQDPRSRLSVELEEQRFDEFAGAVYYLLRFQNLGTEDTPILEAIWPLDSQYRTTETEVDAAAVTLHHAKGSSNAVDDFLPCTTELVFGEQCTLAPVGGRSSNGVLPFFNLTWAGEGLVMAIGWSGQWSASFARVENGDVNLVAGMGHTHLRLRPGESIRTPGILLLPWQGEDWLDGQNRLRALMLAHFTPRQGNAPILPPIAHCTAASLHMHDGGWGGGNEQTQMASIEAIAPLGIESYWLDAYWFPGEFPNGVGNWFHRAEDFPRGLRPLGDAAHARGMQFILWFEPERVGPNTQIEREHPDWLLRGEDTRRILLDLGHEDARRYVTELISAILTEADVDVYRQDFNMDPLPYWQANDAPDRQGMTEIRHVEGLYTFWDELLARHPRLWIDNCASGGRRIDLETCKRSLCLWRSDMADRPIWDEPARARAGLAEQVQTAGLSLWVPLHTGGVWGVDPYRFRSAINTGIVLYDDPRPSEFAADLARQAFAELKTLRPAFLGNYYPLTPLTASEEDWCAYQYHRPDLDIGFALFFRRAEASAPSFSAQLRELSPSTRYQVSVAETYEAGRTSTVLGADLQSLTITLAANRSVSLVTYQAVQ